MNAETRAELEALLEEINRAGKLLRDVCAAAPKASHIIDDAWGQLSATLDADDGDAQLDADFAAEFPEPDPRPHLRVGTPYQNTDTMDATVILRALLCYQLHLAPHAQRPGEKEKIQKYIKAVRSFIYSDIEA